MKRRPGARQGLARDRRDRGLIVGLTLALTPIGAWVAATAQTPLRERISLNADWAFQRHDPAGDGTGLIYDVPPSVRDGRRGGRAPDGTPGRPPDTAAEQRVLSLGSFPRETASRKTPQGGSARAPGGNRGHRGARRFRCQVAGLGDLRPTGPLGRKGLGRQVPRSETALVPVPLSGPRRSDRHCDRAPGILRMAMGYSGRVARRDRALQARGLRGSCCCLPAAPRLTGAP